MTRPTPYHIGIVACSAEGAALCYTTICTEGARVLGGHAHPEITMHTPSLGDYTPKIEQGDWQGVADLMLASAEKLSKAGADFLICPDNTIHQAMEWVRPRSPLPWLHIAETVADDAVGRGFRHLGLTGTKWLVESAVYPDALTARGLRVELPDPAERKHINAIIMDELVHGRFTVDGTATVLAAIERMRRAGCDAVILGCTEIPLIVNDDNATLPTLDSTRLLARAALRKALGSS
jgi:aspartate racemase